MWWDRLLQGSQFAASVVQSASCPRLLWWVGRSLVPVGSVLGDSVGAAECWCCGFPLDFAWISWGYFPTATPSGASTAPSFAP